MQCAPKLPSEVERGWAAWSALRCVIHLTKATTEVINQVWNAVNHFYSRHYTLIKLRLLQASWRQPQTQTQTPSAQPTCLESSQSQGVTGSSPRGRGACWKIQDGAARAEFQRCSQGCTQQQALGLLRKLHPRDHNPLPLPPRERDVFVSAYLARTLLCSLQLTPGLLPRHCILASVPPFIPTHGTSQGLHLISALSPTEHQANTVLIC